MSVHTLLVSNVVSGQEEVARGVLREYSAYLEGLGAQAMVYRTLYSADNVGRALTYLVAEDADKLASILDSVIADGANNPYIKATAAANPPMVTVSRITERSVEADVPPMPRSQLRAVRVYQAPPGRRVEAEQAFHEARLRHESLGTRAAAFLIDIGGASSGLYAYSIAHDSMSALSDFTRRNGQVPSPPPLLSALDRGAIVQVSARVDRLWDLG